MKKNIKISITVVLLIFWFLLIGNQNFRYELKKYTSWVVINFLHSDIFSDPEYNFPEYTSEELDEMFEWVEEYKWELPPIPDKKLNDSTLLWIDSNNNGVRDDLEVHIVRYYWADKMVVEAFFAYVRSNALNKIIQRDWLFTDELYENDIKKRKTLSIWCQWRYFYDSLYNFYSTELYTVAIEFEQKINNTWLREKIQHNSFLI